MLTPEKIAQANKVLGTQVDPSGQKPVQSFADKIRRSAPAEQPTPKGFVEGLSEDTAKRREAMVEAINKSAGPKIPGVDTSPLTGLHLAGQAAGMLGDLGARATSALTPQSVKDFGNRVIEETAAAPLAQSLKPAAEKGIEVGMGLAEKFPETAKVAGDIANIGGLTAAALGAGPALKTAKEFVEGTVAKGVARKAEKAAAKQALQEVGSVDTALKAITPDPKDLTPTEYGDLLRKGKISPKTKTSPASYILDDKEKAVAQKYSHLLQNKDPIKNGGEVMKEIINKDNEVEKFLEKNTTQIWSKARFKKHLLDQIKDIDDVMVPEDRLLKAKSELVSAFVDKLPKNATLKDLWKARKEFDQDIERKLNAFGGSPTLKKEMAKGVRTSVQEFIADSTEDGVYKAAMKDMTDLYDLADIVDQKAVKEKGKSGIGVWLKDNPVAKNVIWYGGGALGAKGVLDVFTPN